MSETWFTSDLHFGHKNILEYEKKHRPFATLEEMHDALITRWNSVVADKDTVYVLGDFVFGKSWLPIAEKLKGQKRLVMGNHDTYASRDYLRYFHKLYGVKFWEQCVLSHIPVHPNQLGSRWFLNVHGHLHSKIVMSNEIVAPQKEYPMNWCTMPDENYFNVSVEHHNLTPVNADVIRERVKQLKE